MMKNLGEKEGYKFMEIKYLKSQFNFPTAIKIYRNNVIQIIFGSEILITLIKSEKAAKGFMEYFNLLWKTAPKCSFVHFRAPITFKTDSVGACIASDISRD